MQLTSDTFNDLRKAIHGLCGLVIADDKQYLIVSPSVASTTRYVHFRPRLSAK